MQVLPRLEQLRSINQRVVRALVHRNTLRQIPHLQRRETVQTRLQSPRVTGVPDYAQNIPPGVERHEIGQEARGAPVVVEDDLRSRCRRVPTSGRQVISCLASMLDAAGRRQGGGCHREYAIRCLHRGVVGWRAVQTGGWTWTSLDVGLFTRCEEGQGDISPDSAQRGAKKLISTPY